MQSYFILVFLIHLFKGYFRICPKALIALNIFQRPAPSNNNQIRANDLQQVVRSKWERVRSWCRPQKLSTKRRSFLQQRKSGGNPTPLYLEEALKWILSNSQKQKWDLGKRQILLPGPISNGFLAAQTALLCKKRSSHLHSLSPIKCILVLK